MSSNKTQRIAVSMMRHIFLAYQNNGMMQKFMEEAYIGQRETNFATEIWEELAHYLKQNSIVIPDDEADGFDDFVNTEIAKAFKKSNDKPDKRKVIRNIEKKIEHIQKGLPFRN